MHPCTLFGSIPAAKCLKKQEGTEPFSKKVSLK